MSKSKSKKQEKHEPQSWKPQPMECPKCHHNRKTVHVMHYTWGCTACGTEFKASMPFADCDPYMSLRDWEKIKQQKGTA